MFILFSLKGLFTFALCLLYSWYFLVIVSLLFAHMIFATFLSLSCIMIFKITRHAIYTKQISTTLVSSHCISERWCWFFLFFFKKYCSFFAGGVNNVFIKYDWFISLFNMPFPFCLSALLLSCRCGDWTISCVVWQVNFPIYLPQ